MTGKSVYRILFIISAMLLVGFAIRITVDYVRYDEVMTSFPFYAFVIERTVEFLLPSLIAFIVALIVKRKSRKE